MKNTNIGQMVGQGRSKACSGSAPPIRIGAESCAITASWSASNRTSPWDVDDQVRLLSSLCGRGHRREALPARVAGAADRQLEEEHAACRRDSAAGAASVFGITARPAKLIRRLSGEHCKTVNAAQTSATFLLEEHPLFAEQPDVSPPVPRAALQVHTGRDISGHQCEQYLWLRSWLGDECAAKTVNAVTSSSRRREETRPHQERASAQQ